MSSNFNKNKEPYQHSRTMELVRNVSAIGVSLDIPHYIRIIGAITLFFWDI